jgi:thiosulfate/3-mercaptopyruvate sulfurtransferase
MRGIHPFRMAVLLALLSAGSYAQQPPAEAHPPAAPADDAVPSAALLQPEELVPLLNRSDADKPLVLQVGPRVFYAEAHVPGSEYIGGGETGLQALRERVKTLPHDRFVVLYCGCCPWKKCPNVRPAYQQLAAAGFTHVQVLYIADNFGANWVSKGYPVEKGR